MASIEYITKRIEGKKKEIAKLEKKLARIKKAQDTNWEVNPYYYDESDLKWTSRDLDDARKALAKYESDLEVANDKAASRNVPAITEFLDKWKERMENLYTSTAKRYTEAYKAYLEEIEPYKMSYFEERRMQKENLEEYVRIRTERNAIEGRFRSAFGFVQPYMVRALNKKTMKYDKFELDKDRLSKDLENEYNRKYDFIIERTNEIVKTITDASGLKVGSKGDLNGYIIGTNGTAKVQTIGAGGYNIQCFHFRTLVHRA